MLFALLRPYGFYYNKGNGDAVWKSSIYIIAS